ncbi:MAG TPA: uracil-DNA glycosylase [Oxalicibacterium sp.]
MSDTTRRTAFLHEMGLGPIWQQRHPASVAYAETPVTALPDEPVLAPVASGPVLESLAETAFAMADAAGDREATIAGMDWDALQSAVSGCTSCNLCTTRTKTVFGVGDRKARWMFIGEGPGRNEDQQGMPFVGPAGKLLDNMMVAMGLKRGENTYIANIVKCRPTDANKRDRPPEADESGACMPYLQRQIALIRPTVIVALGKTAALSLLQLDPSTPVSRLRGKVYRHGDIPLIVTYHPAYLLRNLPDKSKAWADLCLAMQAYEGAS